MTFFFVVEYSLVAPEASVTVIVKPLSNDTGGRAMKNEVGVVL